MGKIRIIAGDLKGRYYLSSDEPGTRPLLGSTKKSLFDILTPILPRSSFLDLYAGFGSSGIEAVSRGADIVRKNSVLLGIDQKCEVIQADVLTGLGQVQGKFDIIFMGPPYKDPEKKMLAMTSPTLMLLWNSSLLKDSTTIVCQRFFKESVVIPDGLELTRTKKYGDTVIDFIKTASRVA
jgi:16S rRNA (guanine966-N2)-methyltransferase